MPRQKAFELTFQQHITDFLVREHKYGVLELADIMDAEHFIAENQLWAFLKATQADARDEVSRAEKRLDPRKKILRFTTPSK